MRILITRLSIFLKIPESENLPMRSSGVTLVELLVAVGLFGVLSLGKTQVFVAFMEQNTRNDREIGLNETMREFSDRLDLELGNMTQLLGCGCGDAASRCVYNDTTAASDCASFGSGCNVPCSPSSALCRTLLIWETEVAQSPGSASSAGNCNGSTALRGCK